MEWNVYLYDFNSKQIITYNIFKHSSFKKEVEDLIRKNLDFNTFSEELKHIAMYYFWGKVEYETVITSFPPYILPEEVNRLSSNKEKNTWYRYYTNLEIGLKIDVYKQLLLNWNRFVDYVFVQ